jgi:hypothetical protein
VGVDFTCSIFAGNSARLWRKFQFGEDQDWGLRPKTPAHF